jgi:cyclopropane fatty-acyl-phospholipid synthase-like methyltransferase
VEYEDQDFHAQFEYRDAAELPLQWKKAVLLQAALISEHVARGGRILEIGCGEGMFLKELRRRGFRTTGLEPSRSASQRARDTGLEVMTGHFPQMQVQNGFDAVVMNHVLEHVREPTAFLKKAGEHAVQGTLFLMQSHWKGLVPVIQKGAWHAWVPEHHYWHFTPKGLKYILRKLHWDVLKIRYSSLSHGDSLLSKIGAAIPGQGDQFHMVIKMC